MNRRAFLREDGSAQTEVKGVAELGFVHFFKVYFS